MTQRLSARDSDRTMLMYVIPGLGGSGGAERSLLAMLPFWIPRIDVHLVLLSNRTDLVPEAIALGARVTLLSGTGLVAQTRELRRLVRRERPDLIHTTLWEADIVGRIAAALTGTPTSTSLVNVNYGAEHRPPARFASLRLRRAQLLDAATARATVRFHALTKHVAETMSQRIAVSHHRIVVLPRGRSRSSLGRCTSERRQRVRADHALGSHPVVLAAARHERQKGLDVLIAAIPSVLREIPEARFLIGGRPGATTALLHAAVVSNRIEAAVRFIGHRDDLPDLMCAADVYCVPSLWEGFGSVLVEAMALRVPTVATAIEPIREVAGNPPALALVPPGDSDSLARAIIELLTNPNLALAYANRGERRFDESFSAEGVAKGMCDFFEAAIRTSRWSSRLRRRQAQRVA